MATHPPAQRAWRALCPHCGAPVELASAASPVAVCSYCRSTLARDGDTLRRIGQSAELFDDHSPLQLGVAGRWQGQGFRLVGRLQLRYADGAWNEWHALFDNGRSGWLAEDNGRHVMAFDAAAPADLPALDSLQPGATLLLAGQRWQVASRTLAQVAAAEGELPQAPRLQQAFTVVDLRQGQNEVATLDYSDPQQPRWSVGRTAPLADLALSGLREASEKTVAARGLHCPSCGAALQLQLDGSQSIVCHQCQAVVDLSQGLGADLALYAQDKPPSAGAGPLLPLGATALLALGGPPAPWQVVGYVERCTVPEDADDEREFWREYLLFSKGVGFTFLIDAEDGWSWATPVTGAPQTQGRGVQWAGRRYRERYSYVGEITYVLGEFYWRLKRGERTRNTDYADGPQRLNREQTLGAGAAEVSWSAGATLDAGQIAAAFQLPPAQQAALAREASPLSGSTQAGPLTRKLVIGLFVLLMLVLMVKDCSSSGCDDIRTTFGQASNEYQQCLAANRSGGGVGFRSGGGAFGGYGGGGGHK